MEMAILMGNDFTHGHSHLDYTGSSTADEVLSYLCEMGEGYTVTTTDGETQMILDFIRSFYGFRDLSQFPLDPEPPMPSEASLSLFLHVFLLHRQLKAMVAYVADGGFRLSILVGGGCPRYAKRGVMPSKEQGIIIVVDF